MTKKIAVVAGTLVVITLAGLYLAGPAFAQSATPAPEATPEAPCFGWGRGFGFWGGGWASFDAAAGALGLTPEEFFAELHAGKTLAEIAEAQGVELQAVRDAVNAARTEEMKAAIQRAVEDGRMSQAEADWLLQGLEQGFLKGGRRGFRPMRGFRGWGPSEAPEAPATGTTM